MAKRRSRATLLAFALSGVDRIRGRGPMRPGGRRAQLPEEVTTPAGCHGLIGGPELGEEVPEAEAGAVSRAEQLVGLDVAGAFEKDGLEDAPLEVGGGRPPVQGSGVARLAGGTNRW